MINYWLLKDAKWELTPSKVFVDSSCRMTAPSGRRFDVHMVCGYHSFEDSRDPNVKAKPLISLHEVDGVSPKAEWIVALEMAGDYFCGRAR